MSESIKIDTARGTESKAVESRPGIGIIATEENADSVAGAVLRANKNGYPALVATADGEDIEALAFAEELGAATMSVTDADTRDDIHDALIDKAESLQLPGLILHPVGTSQIDYKQSNAAFEKSGFSVEAETLEEASIETGTGVDTQSVVAIIPAYNEEETLPDIINRTAPYVDDVIVVNDASTDATEDVARKHADSVITHPKNMGVGGAVHTGYLAAIRSEYDVVIQIDGDGQHDPSYIPEIVDRLLKDEADMIIGSRWLNESYQEYSFVRRAGIKFFTHEANLIGGLSITDVTSGFRGYRTCILDDLGRPENSHWALEQTLEAARKGYTIEEVSVPMPPETDGSQFDIETFLKYPPRMLLTTIKVLLFR